MKSENDIIKNTKKNQQKEFGKIKMKQKKIKIHSKLKKEKK